MSGPAEATDEDQRGDRNGGSGVESLRGRRLLWRLGALAWRHKWAAVPALVSTLLLQVLVLGSLKAQGLAIDLIRYSFDPAAGAEGVSWPFGLAPPGEWGLLTTVAALGGVVLVLGLLAGVARFFNRVFDEVFVQACIVDLRTRLYARLQRLGYRFFDTHDSGQIIQRITADAQSVRSFIQGVMVRGVIALVTLVVFLAFMLREHVWLTLACLSVLPIQALTMVRFARRNRPRFMEQKRLVDVLVSRIQESIAGVRVIRAFGRERFQTERFDRASGDARDHMLMLAKERALHIPVIQAGNFLSLAVLVGFGGYLVIIGEVGGGIALGTLWVFKGLVERLGAQAEAIVWIVGGAPEALAGAERVFGLLEHPLDVEGDPESEAARHFRSGAVRGEVELRNVTFSHETGEPVVRGVSLRAEPGQTVAIVGPTGSGKSTLLSLIARFYDPEEGSVLIDGHDVRDAPPEVVRSLVAYVPQDAFLFSNTVRANVSFGRPGAPEEDVVGVARDARAHGFVHAMDEGYGTIIGERGVSLSGGQRQRLTIARALLIDAPILVLDDATGAVDAVTEAEIQEALDRRRAGRTTFIVAHRLSTLRRADVIYVIDRGEIVDRGTHAELMGREGHYRASGLIQLALEESHRAEGVL